jgi:hypothetical protein
MKENILNFARDIRRKISIISLAKKHNQDKIREVRARQTLRHPSPKFHNAIVEVVAIGLILGLPLQLEKEMKLRYVLTGPRVDRIRYTRFDGNQGLHL